MHELSICLSVVRIIVKEAEIKKYHTVKTVWLEIGVLAGIEKAAIQFSFPIAAKNTLLEDAQLIIIDVDGQARCENCGLDCHITHHLDVCAHCKYDRLQITHGNELRIQKLEVL